MLSCKDFHSQKFRNSLYKISFINLAKLHHFKILLQILRHILYNKYATNFLQCIIHYSGFDIVVFADRIPKPVISKDKQERDVDETKYIGEEKEVEEERKTVAQLKEIFAQDKRDRQYERQPPISEQLPTTPPVKPRKEKVSPPPTVEDISKVSPTPTVLKEVAPIPKSVTEDRRSALEEDISKKQPSPPPSVRTEADQRRDSELFQGVTEELVRLETTSKVISAAEGKAISNF